jgi:hypothetical protein
MLKDEIIQKKHCTKGSKIKKIKKIKLEGNYNFFYWRVKLKRKITSTKGQTKSKE